MSNGNLFAALRGAFPADLDAVAIETADTPVPLHYTWRDLERATAMMANLLESLKLPPASRVAVQTEKSVEALMLYLAVLRAGHVFLPLNTAYQAAEIEYTPADMSPRFTAAHQLIAPYVIGAEGELPGYTFVTSDADFTAALDQLLLHVGRYRLVVGQRDGVAALAGGHGVADRAAANDCGIRGRVVSR